MYNTDIRYNTACTQRDIRYNTVHSRTSGTTLYTAGHKVQHCTQQDIRYITVHSRT